MQRQHVGIVVWMVGLLLAGAVWAQEEQESRWNVSLETRANVGITSVDSAILEYNGLFPKVSFFVHDRLRVDSGFAFGYTDVEGLELRLFPGVRYYYFKPEDRRFRLNGGIDTGFGLFDTPSRSRFGLDPEGGLVRLGEQDELLDLRVVPVELEYWVYDKGAFTLGFDYGGTLLEGGEFDLNGLGVLGGFRWRF